MKESYQKSRPSRSYATGNSNAESASSPTDRSSTTVTKINTSRTVGIRYFRCGNHGGWCPNQTVPVSRPAFPAHEKAARRRMQAISLGGLLKTVVWLFVIFFHKRQYRGNPKENRISHFNPLLIWTVVGRRVKLLLVDSDIPPAQA